MPNRIKVPMGVPYSKSGDMTSSGENGLNIRTIGTGPGVRRSKPPLLASCTRSKIFYGNLRNLVIRPQSVIRFSLLKLIK